MYEQPELPTGTLTFLFTDIENSTVFWEQDQDSMRAAMQRHDALIESAVSENMGVIVRPRGEGDSRFAVFPRASDAIGAAIAIQRQFSNEPWPPTSPLQVRIGLHTGEADLRNGDYYGPAVNRCARIRSSAHGGQTLLSMTTSNLVQDYLPAGVSLRDLGEYRLYNLQRPEHIYQLVIPGLRADFPPLKEGTESVRTNLPLMLNSFIGRGNEIAEVRSLLATTRLLTITGMGGTGKTRLALQVGEELKDSFADGVWWVDLAPITNPELAVKAVANVFDIREDEGRPLLQTLVDVMRPKELLLILDNCEHLLKEAARIAAALTGNALRLHILATSREPLGLLGETVWSIPPLSFPNGKQQTGLDDYLQYDAIKLFVDRASASKSNFNLTDRNAPAVVRISKKLEGNPLAIELASARVKVLSVEDIANRLDNRLSLLAGNKSASHPRQQTLEALIDWSHNLLSKQEQILMRRLGIFKGGWTLEAAEAICAGEEIESWEILDLLASLIDKSLVVPELHEAHQRYRFLEMIRQYALDRLSESGELEQISEKHTAYFLSIAEESYGELWGPKQGYWLSLLQTEHDNFRSALEWTKKDPGRAEMMLRMAGSLWRFWEIHGHIGEGRAWLELALERNPSAPAHMRANGLRGAGFLARQHGDYAQARVFHEQSLALFREIDDELGIARELNVLGEILWMKGNPHAAIDMNSQSLAIHREIGNMEGVAASLEQLGVLARDHGDYQHARELLEESLQKYRALGNGLFIASSLNNLGLVAYLLCEYKQANSLFEEAVSIYHQLNDRWGISETLINLGNVAKDQGYFQKASSLYDECLKLKQDLGDKHGIARVISGQAEIAFYQGSYPTAVELAEQCYNIFKERGIKRGEVVSLMILAAAKTYQGEIDAAQKLSQEGLALSSEIDTPRSLAYTKLIYGLSEYNRGDLEAAAQYQQDALEIFRNINDGRSIAQTLVNLARTAYRRGDRAAAIAYLDESLSLSRELDIRWSLAYSLEIKALLKRSEGDIQAALELFNESLMLSVEQANQQGIANSLGAIAGLAALHHQPAESARLFAAAANIRESMNVKMGADDQREYEQYLAILREALDEDQFIDLMLEGCTLDMNEAVDHAYRLVQSLKAVEEAVQM